MPWEQTSIQGVGKRKVGDLGVHQRVQFVANGTPPQKIRLPALYFPRTRSAEDKPNTQILDQPVDFVEQCRYFLHFVDNDGRRVPFAQRFICLTLLSQNARVAQEPLIFAGEKQIVRLGTREKLL